METSTEDTAGFADYRRATPEDVVNDPVGPGGQSKDKGRQHCREHGASGHQDMDGPEEKAIGSLAD